MAALDEAGDCAPDGRHSMMELSMSDWRYDVLGLGNAIVDVIAREDVAASAGRIKTYLGV
jgi:hypothetical protein